MNKIKTTMQFMQNIREFYEFTKNEIIKTYLHPDEEYLIVYYYDRDVKCYKYDLWKYDRTVENRIYITYSTDLQRLKAIVELIEYRSWEEEPF